VLWIACAHARARTRARPNGKEKKNLQGKKKNRLGKMKP